MKRDNAGENKSEELQNLLLEMGVKSEFSAPREQYQNGAAERAIRTILDTARTVLAASGLSGAFWSCAIQYATQV